MKRKGDGTKLQACTYLQEVIEESNKAKTAPGLADIAIALTKKTKNRSELIKPYTTGTVSKYLKEMGYVKSGNKYVKMSELIPVDLTNQLRPYLWMIPDDKQRKLVIELLPQTAYANFFETYLETSNGILIFAKDVKFKEHFETAYNKDIISELKKKQEEKLLPREPQKRKLKRKKIE